MIRRLEQIVGEALERPEHERAEFLAHQCSTDDDLRREAESLLRAHGQAGDFLLYPTPPVPTPGGETLLEAATSPAAESAGSVIGPYKLLQQIGEGGYGTVYMAEQRTPVQRRVAVKVIKLGMDTRSVLARFEAERQALALMDHPNIARVLDAGATQAGRPYFAMELVRGVPITTFCDNDRLGVRDRLGLFIDVCHAVQHAHTKGIIHRDLKPSNILVSRYDDRPAVKVIDFGIAKAVGGSGAGRLTDKTLFTDFRQFIGTPAYMSPEQAGMSDLDIDTRGDVYSLGVLLYELLTGATPIETSASSTPTTTRCAASSARRNPPPPARPSPPPPGAAPEVPARRRLSTTPPSPTTTALRSPATATPTIPPSNASSAASSTGSS